MSEFQNGILGCFEDCGTCLITYFCPCVTAGRNAEAVGENCVLCGFLTLLGPIGIVSRGKVREKIREKYGIAGSLINDLICHCCCPLCALVQESQELRGRGGMIPGEMSMSRE